MWSGVTRQNQDQDQAMLLARAGHKADTECLHAFVTSLKQDLHQYDSRFGHGTRIKSALNT
jgi:hypothetical protein